MIGAITFTILAVYALLVWRWPPRRYWGLAGQVVAIVVALGLTALALFVT